MTVMNGESAILGIAKCRKFTRLVDFNQTKHVVSAALANHYCDLAGLPTGRASNTANSTGQWRDRHTYYSSFRWFLAGFLLIGSLAQAEAHGTADQSTIQTAEWIGETGTASFYGKAHHGKQTASGTRFDQEALTAAHPWLPFGTRLRVTIGNTSRSVVVIVTDRLYSHRRVIDLSVAAARRLGMIQQGIATVSLSPA